MRPRGPTELDDVVARFQAEIHRLAVTAARTIVEQELARRRAALEPARPRKGRPAPPAVRQLELGFGQAPARKPERQLELPLAASAAAGAPRAEDRAEPPAEPSREGEPAGAPDAAAPGPAPGSPAPGSPAPGSPAPGRGRMRWTRDSIIAELATWLLSGTLIDAQFMTRHGPKGLVAASRRVFGRFEAALNLAALHNAKLYPEGPPARGMSAGPRTVLAAPPREPK